jgi:hypothetical protein
MACSCVTCRGERGLWCAGAARVASTIKTATLNTTYTAPQCKREFSFEAGDAQIFEVSLSLFERRHFYESGLRTSS